MPNVDLATLRTYAVSRSLFATSSLKRAIERLGFVQADPIRAPARAQDLTLRHRVTNYRAGDLDRRYVSLGIEEDFFINYGFVSAPVHALMHPRYDPPRWPETPRTRVHKLLAFVRTHGEVHPRRADEHFAHGTVTNYWGGSSNATTHLLDHLHYRGWLRIARREGGIRIYTLRETTAAIDHLSPRARLDALVDVVVKIYAPLPAVSLSSVVARLRYAVPQWRGLLKDALRRARTRLDHARVDGVEYYWPANERPRDAAANDSVRLLAPFDPVVWDRRRFELLWGWPYRFEAYTPAAKRRFGYYALPMLWRDRVIGWANMSVVSGALTPELGFVESRRPGEKVFSLELDAELDRFSRFLGL